MCRFKNFRKFIVFAFAGMLLVLYAITLSACNNDNRGARIFIPNNQSFAAIFHYFRLYTLRLNWEHNDWRFRDDIDLLVERFENDFLGKGALSYANFESTHEAWLYFSYLRFTSDEWQHEIVEDFSLVYYNNQFSFMGSTLWVQRCLLRIIITVFIQ